MVIMESEENFKNTFLLAYYSFVVILLNIINKSYYMNTIKLIVLLITFFSFSIGASQACSDDATPILLKKKKSMERKKDPNFRNGILPSSAIIGMV